MDPDSVRRGAWEKAGSAQNKMTDSPKLVPETVIHPGGFPPSLTDSDPPTHAQNGKLEDVPLGKKEESPESTLENELHTPSPSPPLPNEYYCGVGRCHPKWMQVFRDAKFFTFLLSLNCFIEGALVSGFTSVILSSIERRYRFSSTAAGFIASTFDMAVLVSVIFISYFGGKGHKPRWLGISLIVMGVGSFVFALPQFLFGSYSVGSRGSARLEACLDDYDFSSECTQSNNAAYAFFILGNILIGVGAAPLFTVGTAFIDEIVHPKWVPVHIGVFYAVSIIGPAMGYGLGGAFLTVYVDPWRETDLDPSDPGWVGAWWLSFVFVGVISLLASIPFLLFPRLLPDSDVVKLEREKEMAKTYKSKYGIKENADLLTTLKAFPAHLKSVVVSLSWVFITISITSSLLIVSGMTAFAPKYLESQFGLTASTASLTVGAIAIPMGGTGVIGGALIIHFTKSKGRRVSLIHAIISLLLILPMLMFLVHCPTLDLAGVTVGYQDGSPNTTVSSTLGTDILSSPCNLGCNCTSTIFEPVCGADGLTYFSPCRAGCDKYFPSGDTENPVFENCSCVATRLLDVPTYVNSTYSEVLGTNSTATDGLCDQGCNQLGLFLFFTALTLFLVFMLYTPNVIITIRCVAEEQRTLALGLQSVVFRAFGTIPGPIVFGAIFDSACIYWQYECDRRGNCWVYDNTALSVRALALAISGVSLNFIFSFLCWLVYPRGKKTKDKGSGQDSSTPSQSESSESQGQSDQPIKGTVVFNRMESQVVLLESVDSAIREEEEEVGSDSSLHAAHVRSVDHRASSPLRVLESPTPSNIATSSDY